MLPADWQSALTAWQWGILALVPLGILALYLLKLRRQRIEVPSTYLWSRALEDLHVNALWQRLRRSLLLWLQLLMVALVALALARPGWRGGRLPGHRFIFLIDCSASMAAEDVPGGRLAQAKQQALGLIERMQPGDTAMVISFSNTARVEQSFTDNRRLLRAKVQQIAQTQRGSDVREALRAAAGLANPGQSGDPDNPQDLPAAEALPATMYVLSDGGFQADPSFKLGNLKPVYLPLGTAEARNVAIAAFNTAQHPQKPDHLQAFARLENYSTEPAEVELTLSHDGTLLDVQRVTITAREPRSRLPGVAGVQFNLTAIERGVLELHLQKADHLEADNRAWAVINPPRPATVLLVTPGTEALVLALQTEEVRKVANVEVAGPSFLTTSDYLTRASTGQYDLVIYDQCTPAQPPSCNALWIGCLPPVPAGGQTASGQAPSSDAGWSAGPLRAAPVLIDSHQSHPLTHLVQMQNVLVLEARALRGPPGTFPLIEADIGPVYAIAPRGSYEDAVLGMPLVTFSPEGNMQVNTNWPRRRSFPVFVLNAVKYLGGVRNNLAMLPVTPGAAVTLRLTSGTRRASVETPRGERLTLEAPPGGNLVFTQTDALGVYQVREDESSQVRQQFAVNLFDGRESDLTPAEKLNLGYEEVAATRDLLPQRRELWRWLVLAALGVVLLEWYVYHRRVYF
jgi:hypothetical protein